MGVRGLHGFVGSSCPQVCTEVNFRELAEQHRSEHPGRAPTIVVDAMCCLRYWYTPESWVCGGQWKEYFSVLEDFVRTFTAAGIRLVFFFDGMVEQDKRDEWVRRRLKNSREIARIFRYLRAHGEQPGRSMFFIPSGLAIFTRFALKTLGQDTMCSLQEADYEVAAYGRQNGCLGILGEDTDYLIYDTCPYFSIGELCLDSLTTIMLCRQKLCASLGLGLPDLPLLACLLGNDIVPEGTFETFRYKCLSSYTSVRENCDKKGSVVFAVADHISKVLRLHRGERKLEEMLPLGPNKALFYKAMASYLLPGQKSPWIPQTPKAVTTLDKQEVPMSSDPESKQEVPVNLEPEIKQQVTMVSDTEILEVARARHVQAESYLVYSVLTSGEVECSNTLEDALDQALPSQAFVYRPVRQRVYALLLADSQGGRAVPGGPARLRRTGLVPPGEVGRAARGLAARPRRPPGRAAGLPAGPRPDHAGAGQQRLRLPLEDERAHALERVRREAVPREVPAVGEGVLRGGPGGAEPVSARQVPPAEVRRVQGLPGGGPAHRQPAALAAAPHREMGTPGTRLPQDELRAQPVQPRTVLERPGPRKPTPRV
ncbi:constitutive coactivator of peroxisome proliferator-activated receptor gamma isoform X3 [Phyllostomus hastatus]|uniref:constitutive coactivator of peroxisome proliferator-activated receptor gamma isoform X3 n=1 Tax=Phyllostomus hastatus TaxID=9423 RepID=UPI001E67E2A0|nr:constitutive coactivator of peroxisome proliferator-activated receptor gamma isoform X3 [Phyllostomus hastatus]